jgi:signal transduction histidine kinase/CheY-like chemotaxis protein
MENMREDGLGLRASVEATPDSGSMKKAVIGLDIAAGAVVVAAAVTHNAVVGFAALAVWLVAGACLDARRIAMLRFGIWMLIGTVVLVWWGFEGGPIGTERTDRFLLGAMVLASAVGYVVSRRLIVRQGNVVDAALEAQREVDFMARTTQSVAHDLRNVFQVVNSCAVDLYDEMHGRRAGVLVLEILNAAERGLGVTTELVLAGKGQFVDDRPADLRLLTCELEPILRRLATPGVAVHIDCDAGAVFSRIGRTSMMQILMNLVDNAAEAMSRTGNITVRVQRGLRHGLPGTAPSPVAVLIVRDDGPGMPVEVADRVFDVGFSTKEGHHAGLGLAVVQSVVARHYGSVVVRSVEGEGTEFRIEFPLVERTEKDLALVVLANHRARRLVSEALIANGFDVLESADALEACDLVGGLATPAMAVLDADSATDAGLRQMANLADVPLVRTVGDRPGLSAMPTTHDEVLELLQRGGRPNGVVPPPAVPDGITQV